jgi:hypothetical protein
MKLRLLATTHGETSVDDSCPVNSCPAVYELADGSLMFQGSLTDLLGKVPCHDDEGGVILPRGVVEAAMQKLGAT